jgi:SRSO17 transposase
MAWTADEFYGRDGTFLDGLDERGEAFVVEVNPNTHVWLRETIVGMNVLTNDTEYFLSNQVPGRLGWTLRKILRVAFGRWPVEDCFREAKEELGLDHFECRSWHGIHRHRYITILSHLMCARIREKFSKPNDVMMGELLTTTQVR